MYTPRSLALAPDSDDLTRTLAPTLAALTLHRSLSNEETLGENRNI